MLFERDVQRGRIRATRDGRTGTRRDLVAWAALAVVLTLIPGSIPAAGQDEDVQQPIRGTEVSPPVTPFVFDGDVRILPRPREWRPGDPVREIPMRRYFLPGSEPFTTAEPGPDPLVELQQAATGESSTTLEFTQTTRSFTGQGYTGVNPPDTVGDVGPDHYIQSINSGSGALVRIWDKAEPAPNQLASFAMDSLGGGSCSNGYGDPIVLYDRQAERWMISEFASSGNHLCVYVSQTADPVSGGWYAYDFATPTFPDYPKYAVWATDVNGGDGSYVVTANDGGPGVYALDRGAMLTGQAATFQKLSMPGLPGFGIQGPAPADPDGPMAPPAGDPAIVMRHRDTEVHSGPPATGDVLEMWLFQVDWDTPSNTTLTKAADVDVSEFDSTVCGLAFSGCFSQPGSSTTLMPIREVIMNRLQYYNHVEFETLVGNFVVDANGANQGGVRWFELRRDPGGAWSTFQEGTYAIDGDNRWMGSIAMDQSQNIGLAYNVVSSSTYPSLRYTGRKADDAPGVMTQTEGVIHAGTAANSSYRYGDYAAMGLDPTDDCTFWFTGMDNTSSNWRTQVASFRFELCGCAQAPLAPAITAEVTGANEVQLTWDDSELDTVIEYRIERSRTPGGPYELVAVVADSSPDFSFGPGYSYLDTDVSGDITYYYVLIATDGEICRSKAVNEVSVTAEGFCSLRPIFSGLTGIQDAEFSTCTIELNWDAALPECGGPVAYNVYRSTDPGFVPGPATLLAGGVPQTSATDVNSLNEGVTYHYAVRAIDLGNGVEDLNEVRLSAQAAGPNTGLNTVLFEDFEAPDAFDDWTVLTGPNQHRCGEWERSSSTSQRPSGGSGFYALSLSDNCIELLPLTSTSLDSPPIALDGPGVLSVSLEFDIYYNHKDGDDATVEVWDGSAWQVIWADSNADVNERMIFDVSSYAIGNPAFQVRFNYQGANDDLWYAVDDVAVIADIYNACFAGSTPPSVPAGLGTRASLGADLNAPNGDTIQVTYDTSCGAPQVNLLYGDLANVSTAAVSGSVCDVDPSGAFDWTGLPAGDLFFLLVGSDGAETESSWGEAELGERGGLTSSGQCGAAVKNVTNVCE